MKKLLYYVLFCSNCVLGQVGLGTSQPSLSSNLHVSSSDRASGMLFGMMTNQKRDLIQNPANGLVVFSLDDNCLQINTGSSSAPLWKCLTEKVDIPIFSEMTFGKYKPIYPGLPGSVNIGNTIPSYTTTNNQLYGNISGNGEFAKNDIFKIEVSAKDNITYSSILYNISNDPIEFSSNTVAFHNSAVFPNVSLASNQGIFIDGDTRTYYTEAQNIFIHITGPAGSPHVGRKFLIGLNIFKEDSISQVTLYGTGNNKENQSMLTYIFEFK